jgi:hypothetical protein
MAAIAGAFAITLYTGQASKAKTNSTTAHIEKQEMKNVKPVTDKKVEGIQTTSADKQVSYPYIVLNGFYYAKTGDTVSEDYLGQEIARVERTGEWNIKKQGDSNEVVPGPIYSVRGKDSKQFITAKGVVYKDGKNQSAYLLFQKRDPVESVDEKSILSTKGDATEGELALQNIRKVLPTLYEYRDNTGTTTVDLAAYRKDFGPGAMLYYRVPSKDTTDKDGHEIPGFIMSFQYNKSIKIYQSQLNPKPKGILYHPYGEEKEVKPQLIETFIKNNTNWELYKTYYGNYIMQGKHGNMIYELQLQGDFKSSDVQIIATNFRKYK